MGLKTVANALGTKSMRFTYGVKSELDEKDWEILHLISKDARMPVSTIARKLGFTREIVKYRLRKMEKDGVITYQLWTNPPKLGYSVWGFMSISFKDLTPAREKEFIEYVQAHPYVSFAYSALGRFDFGLEFFTRDLGHFYEMQKEIKEKFANIIKDYETGTFIDVYKVNYVPRESETKEAKEKG